MDAKPLAAQRNNTTLTYGAIIGMPVAVIELGSVDAAAERLHVTPSAVSQRIKALEQRVGQVLVVREKPCTATAADIPLLRLAAQTALLEAEVLAEMGGGEADQYRLCRYRGRHHRSPGPSGFLPTRRTYRPGAAPDPAGRDR
jgi:DNA-binding transcriptional LysR family regulator